MNWYWWVIYIAIRCFYIFLIPFLQGDLFSESVPKKKSSKKKVESEEEEENEGRS